MQVARWRIVAIVVLACVTAFVAAYGITRASRTTRDAAPAGTASRTETRTPTATGDSVRAALAAPPQLPSAAGATAARPSPAGVRARIAGPARATGLGGRLLARVVDAATGTVLFDAAGATPASPASTAKLLTAAAILAVHRSSDTFTTRVVDAGHGTLVLVGGGDPTLSAAKAGRDTVYPAAARISDLAAQVRAAGTTVRRIVVDGSLFSGPSIAPTWDRTDIGTDYAAPITAVMADGAQIGAVGDARTSQPDLAAGADLAADLGLPARAVSRGTAPSGATQVAVVHSAPVSQLVTDMLQESDNVIADVLARQVAVAVHRPASFTGACAAIRAVLARFGVRVGGGMKDGSGLSSDDRVAPGTLAAVLRLIAGYGPSSAAPLRFIASALPVAGWSGTLADRFVGDAAAGRVRAKTGTLSTVSSLAGLVRDADGRLLVFALDADRVVGTDAAEAALDRIVEALASCGCR